jgi:DNA (cytosine-5)-methyltransferase 1
MVLKSTDFGIPQNRQRIYIVLWRKGLSKNFSYPEPMGKDVTVGDILEKSPASKYTISDRLWNGHKRRKIQNKTNGKGFGYGLVSSDSLYTNTISARYYKDGSEILVSQKNKNPRKLTPKEASFLQGFPPEFIVNQSDVQAYKQFGNSVTVPVIASLAKQIRIQLLKV